MNNDTDMPGGEQRPVPDVGMRATQAVAADVLRMPELAPGCVELLCAAPDDVLPLLWAAQDNAPPTTAAWTKAALLLDTLLLVAGMPRKAQAVFGTLRVLGATWRAVPVRYLAQLVGQWCAPMPRLCALQMRHVAQWAIANVDAFDGSTGQYDGEVGNNVQDRVDVTPGWDATLAAALRWRPHDEIQLRMHPFSWEHAVPGAESAVFRLVPIAATQQLVDVAEHREGICSLERAEACRDGLQAWWLATAVFASRAPRADVTCAIGLVRAAPGDDWEGARVFAPPQWFAHARAAAKSLRAQANAARRLAAMSGLARDLAVSAEELGTSFKSILQAQARGAHDGP